MLKNPKRKALYEVIGKASSKAGYSKTLERLREAGSGEKVSDTTVQAEHVPDKLAKWPKKPRFLQLNAGRVEFSIPYQLAIALALGVVLLMLVVFRFGQSSGSGVESPEIFSVEPAKSVGSGTKAVSAVVEKSKPALPVIKSKGNNRIVIKEFSQSADLEPVRRHFAKYGINTEIIKSGSRFFLRTVGKYENPARKGTDGYEILQKIRQAGLLYKAPAGYETFGQKPFQDAYGRKFND